jgi:hypothetical protein
MCFIKEESGTVRHIREGDCIHATWYHSASKFFRTADRGLYMSLLPNETYNGSLRHCTEMIKSAGLAGGNDFCVRMMVHKRSDGTFYGKADHESLELCRAHVRSERHVYGCDLAKGMIIWAPRASFDKDDNLIVDPDHRFSLDRTFVDDSRFVVGGLQEHGPLPKFQGNLTIASTTSHATVVPVYTLPPRQVVL